MPMKRELYPPDWDYIASSVKVAAEWKCAECGVQCRRPGDRFQTHRLTLTVAHLDHNPGNCVRENLRALCAPCHLRYDAAEKARRRRAAAEARAWVQRKYESRPIEDMVDPFPEAEMVEAFLAGWSERERKKP